MYSTNVWDIYKVLGIEATRAILFTEISGLFENVGVNYRHLCLLCDFMTRFGRLMSIDRYGINKNDIGTLAKASFEETEKILLKAALFCVGQYHDGSSHSRWHGLLADPAWTTRYS